MRSIQIKLLLSALLTLTTGGAAVALEGNAEKGAQLTQTCAACHGPDGEKTLTADYPRLAGQYPDYLEKALKDYRDGVRPNLIMLPLTEKLSNQDIADIAAFYAGQKGTLQDLSHIK